MANVVVKTIWQSKEINEAGDPPSGVETRAQSTRDLLGKAGPKAFPKKKKAVSFHGVEPPQANEGPSGHLNLKRSSACTNVSLLNLTGDDSESTDDGAGRGAAPLSPPLPSGDPAWSEDDTDPPTPLDMVNSGLVRAKDSVTSLKERASRVNRRVQSLQSECSMLCDNLEHRRREAEDLEKYCTQLQESCHKVSQSVEDAEIKTNALKKSSVLLEVRAWGSGHCWGEARQAGALLQEACSARVPSGVGSGWQQTQAVPLPGRANRTAQALSQLRTELEGLRQVKPLLEDVAHQLGSLRVLEQHDQPPTSCASQGCVSTQSLGQIVERAVTPLLEELRHCGLPPTPCPACQRLQKKIRELEQAALETHARAETLSSNLRLAQDEALRAKTYDSVFHPEFPLLVCSLHDSSANPPLSPPL
uniref:Testis specific serine kinase substrate n=1 Tax=Chelonoidis abingdonii TaxID=106734 RepID=A0A8C0G606_CHEAB